MPTININGVDVEFPHEPYPCQVVYMKELLTALNNSQNAILESPTGTGKTLCLLCTSLAWIGSISSGVPLRNTNRREIDPYAEIETAELRPPLAKVIFASRTHSQLAQAVKVLKQTAYAHRNVSVIGSRDQLCLLPEVNMLESNSAKVLACRSRVQTRTCEYYRNFDMKRDNITNTLKADGVVDIEDLVTLGKSTRCCPYYMSRELKSNADLIFMPYNYLLDPKVRRLYNIELDNTVVIFDEAHNIEQVCEDAASVFLASSVLASAIEYLRTVCEVVFNSNDPADADNQNFGGLDANANVLAALDITRAGENKIRSLSLEKLLLLKGQLIELERLVDGLEIPEAGLTKETEFLLDLLGRAGITNSTKETVFETIEEVLSAATSAENLKLRKPKGISEISEFLKTVFDSKGVLSSSLLFPHGVSLEPDFSRCYRLFIKDELIHSPKSTTEDRVWDNRGSNRPKIDRTLSYWCLSPGRAMQDLIRGRVRCVILTSGTLYPVEPIETELNMIFDVKLKNPHVIKTDQVRVAVLTRGCDGQILNSTYVSRERQEFRISLGLTLLNIMPIVPSGFLVFFPSYSMMNQCLDTWKTNQIYDRMLLCKRIFVEPRDKVLFTKVLSDYRLAAAPNPATSANDVDGAALFAVMRGRASEGMDLADYACRGVAILGLPYPPFMDPRVKLKMAYLDEQHTELLNQVSRKKSDGTVSVASHPTGRTWYNIQAWRTVNQSVGRVIRHHRDFGTVFLCDQRFATAASQSQLPKWMQSSVHVYEQVTPAIKETSVFYKIARIKYKSQNSDSQNNSGSSNIDRTKRYDIHSKRNGNLDNMTPTGLMKHPSNAVPKANQVEIFAPNLYGCVVEATDPLPTYVPHDEVSSHVSLTSSSVFDSIENVQLTSTKTAMPSTDPSEECDDEALTNKLIRARPAKRLRVAHQADSTEPPAVRFVKLVRTHFQTQFTPEKSKDCLERFKQALHTYQAATTTSGQDAQNKCVDVLFGELNALFHEPEAHKLLADSVCFLHPAHRRRFAELCQALLRDASKSDTTTSATKSSASQLDLYLICCSKCNTKPPRTPLISTCQHIACFSCWRQVIEEGNRRCPSCKTLLRRRNLTRLIIPDDAVR